VALGGAQGLVPWRPLGQGLRVGQTRLSLFGIEDAGTAKHHDGRFNPLFALNHLGLEQFELHAHGAQIGVEQELRIGKGQVIAALGASVERWAHDVAGILIRRREIAGQQFFGVVHRSNTSGDRLRGTIAGAGVQRRRSPLGNAV
jgi:hypothetical protein